MNSILMNKLAMALYHQHKQLTRHDCFQDVLKRNYVLCDICMYLEPVMKELQKQAYDPLNEECENEI